MVDLPEGALDVALTRPNIVDPEAFRATLQAALERAGALSGGPISLVLPDPAVRLVLVEGGGLKGRRAEAEETIRFRLHKALPFDVRGARIAWDGVRSEQALVAVALDEVVSEYEETLESLGFQPGLVEVSSLALASLDDSAVGDRLLVNWDEGYVSFLLQRGDQPLLVRTLPGEVGAASVARQATSTLQFYQDRLGGSRLDSVVLRAAAGLGRGGGGRSGARPRCRGPAAPALGRPRGRGEHGSGPGSGGGGGERPQESRVTRPLNLARRPFRNERLPTLLLVLGCVVLLAVSVRHAFAVRGLLPERTAAIDGELVEVEQEVGALRRESERAAPTRRLR